MGKFCFNNNNNNGLVWLGFFRSCNCSSYAWCWEAGMPKQATDMQKLLESQTSKDMFVNTFPLLIVTKGHHEWCLCLTCHITYYLWWSDGIDQCCKHKQFLPFCFPSTIWWKAQNWNEPNFANNRPLKLKRVSFWSWDSQLCNGTGCSLVWHDPIFLHGQIWAHFAW